MSVSITLYENISDDNILDKDITLKSTLSGTFKTPFDIEKPILVIENSGIVNANYCFVGEFGRYYFIDNIEIISNNMVALHLTVDVLMSFKNSIKALQCDIDTSTSDYDEYLSSGFYVSTVKTKTDVVQFSGGFNDTGEYILITAGGS